MSSEPVVYAHRIVLRAASPVLAKVVTGNKDLLKLPYEQQGRVMIRYIYGVRTCLEFDQLLSLWHKFMSSFILG